MAVSKRLDQQTEQSDCDHLFWNYESSQSHPLRKLQQVSQRKSNKLIVDKHIDVLSATQRRDPDFFWQEAASSNLLAFLHWTKGENNEALQQLEHTLEHAPNNLHAMVGKIRILEENCRNSEAKKVENNYHKLNEDAEEMKRQKIICRGEIAYACSFLGPDFYMSAIDRYEVLLREALTITDRLLHPYMIRWQYYLAYTYNRMLNKGHIPKLAEKLGTNDAITIFEKISELYIKVIESDDPFYKGKAMIDLVDAFKKCETSGSHKSGSQKSRRLPSLRFLYGSPDKYVKRAMGSAPDDAHVLERCGRHYRQKACCMKDFEKAVEIFDHLTELYPERHVAWHHKGLAYRAMWHIVGKYQEAVLYTNSQKRGNKKGVRKQNHTHKHILHDDNPVARPLAAKSHLRMMLTDNALTGTLRSTSVDESTSSVRDNSNNMRVSPAAAPLSAPPELPTLPSRNRQPIGEVPRQMTKPDFFDKLRTSNPASKDDDSEEYLHRAKECFAKAKEVTKGTCSPYIVDLARCYISLGQHTDAKREFEQGNGLSLSGSLNDNDATYLYEQWALLRHSLLNQDEGTQDAKRNEELLINVAPLYRQAILSTVRAREKSRMAFYKLRDLLCELKDDPDNKVLELEYKVLKNSTENFSECKEMLVEALGKDKDTQDIAWEMIELLNGRRHKRDAATAFVYLTALHEAGQLEVDRESPDSHKNRQLLLDVVRRLAAEAETSTVSAHTFGDVFRWSVGSRPHISDLMPLSQEISELSLVEKSEICILAPKDDTPGVDSVNRILELCGIEAAKAYCDGNCDILYGCPILQGLAGVVASSQAVLVVEDSTDTENWSRLSPVLEQLMGLNKVNVCLVADANTDCSKTEPHYVNHWSRVIVRQECDDLELAHKLLTTLLCKQIKQCVECGLTSTSA